MKSHFLRLSLAATCGLATLATSQGSLSQGYYSVLLPPSRAVATITVTPPKQITPEPAAAEAPTPVAQWVDIKDYTFDQRETLLAGLSGVLTRVEAQTEELKAKRASLPANARTADWDFAMKEVVNARTSLKSACVELAKATAETWIQQRDRVGEAWVRTQNAYASVKSSTTM